jgi:hypothetical protein
MGNFYGGSTLIKGGKFASHDPADDGVRYNSPKKKSATAQNKTSNKKSSKAKKPQDPRKLLESARKSLLHIIIDQMLMGREAIKIPKTTHPALQAALEGAGSPVAWAVSQEEFDTLEQKKRKQREARQLKNQQRQQVGTVTVEVKRKKPVVTPARPVHAPKPVMTEEDIYQANRVSLIRSLVDQMIKKRGALTVPNLDRRLLEEVKSAGSPLLWLQAQPDYEAVFKARYVIHQKATAPVPKKPTQPPRKKKKKKQKLVAEGGTSQSTNAQGKPKKKRVKQYHDPYEKPSRPVTPLSDAPVGYILKQLDKASHDTFNPRKIDWDVT